MFLKIMFSKCSIFTWKSQYKSSCKNFWLHMSQKNVFHFSLQVRVKWWFWTKLLCKGDRVLVPGTWSSHLQWFPAIGKGRGHVPCLDSTSVTSQHGEETAVGQVERALQTQSWDVLETLSSLRVSVMPWKEQKSKAGSFM